MLSSVLGCFGVFGARLSVLMVESVFGVVGVEASDGVLLVVPCLHLG